MKSNYQFQQTKQVLSGFAMAVAFAGMLAFPEFAMAQGQDATGAKTSVTNFFTNLNGILNVASLAVVTIAIIFAGYQIAFNHKRFSDVATVLIGGFLIGAAAQIAKMLLPKDVTAIGGMAQLAADALKGLYA